MRGKLSQGDTPSFAHSGEQRISAKWRFRYSTKTLATNHKSAEFRLWVVSWRDLWVRLGYFRSVISVDNRLAFARNG
jgi:hypothetical protein